MYLWFPYTTAINVLPPLETIQKNRCYILILNKYDYSEFQIRKYRQVVVSLFGINLKGLPKAVRPQLN